MIEKKSIQGLNLYSRVRDSIYKDIYYGNYPDGAAIPSERALADMYHVSRVTVRKALDLLEEEKIISRIQGSGTRVSLDYGARRGNMDIITIVAPAQNAFFAKMMDAVQTKADEMDSLVLFQQKPKDIPLEKCLFRIYRKGFRNLILWKEDLEIPQEFLYRLKGMGMSVVLFDTPDPGNILDSVSLDNASAISGLVAALHASEGTCAYVTWDHPGIDSLRIREDTFHSAVPSGDVFRIPYEYHNRESSLGQEVLADFARRLSQYDTVIYAVGELGMLFEGAAHLAERPHRSGMIGMIQGAKELGIYVIEQDFPAMADSIIECLQRQNTEHGGWIARNNLIPGYEV